MSRSDWIWMPHAAHLIVSKHCQFHLATVIDEYIISTVGEWWPERSSREIHASIYDPGWHAANDHLMGDAYDRAYMKRFGFEDIGADRTYETMVFLAKASIEGMCESCPFVIVSGESVDLNGYSNGGDAYRGHLAMCERWAEGIPGGIQKGKNEV